MKTTEPTPIAKPDLKTLMLSIGAKGGTGKTIAMLGIADWLAVNKRAFTPMDCDHENRGKLMSFANAFPEGAVGRANLTSAAACDNLLYTASESAAGLILADLPAASGLGFLNWWKSVCTPENLAELNLRVIMVGVITREPGTFGAVANWAKVLQGTVNYVIALNHRYPAQDEQSLEDLIPDYFATETGRNFRDALKPVELEIPAMQETAMLDMLTSNRLPSLAAESKEIKVLNRTRIRCWANLLHTSLDAANETLRLLN